MLLSDILSGCKGETRRRSRPDNSTRRFSCTSWYNSSNRYSSNYCTSSNSMRAWCYRVVRHLTRNCHNPQPNPPLQVSSSCGHLGEKTIAVFFWFGGFFLRWSTSIEIMAEYSAKHLTSIRGQYN